jgi:lipoprotein NlpD
MREISRMQSRHNFWLLSAASLALLSACTTNIPAPVVDRGVRPVSPPTDVRAMPPGPSGALGPQASPVVVTPINPNLPGNTPGSQFHVVQRGETLYGIARTNGLDLNALIAWNNMTPGAPLREGQVLRLSPSSSVTSAQSMPPSAGVAPGTTVTAIAATGAIVGQPLPAPSPSLTPIVSPTVSPTAVPSVNPVDAPLKREPKSQRVPFSDAALAAMQRGDGAATASVDTRVLGPSPATSPGAAASAPVAATVPASAPLVDVEIKPGNTVDRDGISWTWPTSGKVASKFNEKAPMKGIDIATNAGAAVVAAAAGKVIYVGKEPRGYGQMIVVNHAKETVSVYFHTDKVQVKEQQRVLLGQKLAEVADGSSNKIHFEVRRQGRPLDPASLMPR